MTDLIPQPEVEPEPAPEGAESAPEGAEYAPEGAEHEPEEIIIE